PSLSISDPAPLAVALDREVRGSKRGDRRAKEAVGDGEIEQTVAGRAGGLVQFRQMLAEPAISVRIVVVARQVLLRCCYNPNNGLVTSLRYSRLELKMVSEAARAGATFAR